MAHDVFISYSKADKLVADAICAKLEQSGIRCWIAPRDVLGGQDYGKSIIEAINGSRVMVVVFSAESDKSPFVNAEVEAAFRKRIAILPFRIEETLPTHSMEFFLSKSHWFDAITPPLETHIARLIYSVAAILGIKIPEQEEATRAPAATSPPPLARSLPSPKLLAQPRLLRTLEGHTSSVNAASFSPDGKTVLTGSDDNTARLWDAATERELARILIDSGVNAAAFAPDGRSVILGKAKAFLLTFWRTGNAQIWQVAE